MAGTHSWKSPSSHVPLLQRESERENIQTMIRAISMERPHSRVEHFSSSGDRDVFQSSFNRKISNRNFQRRDLVSPPPPPPICLRKIRLEEAPGHEGRNYPLCRRPSRRIVRAAVSSRRDRGFQHLIGYSSRCVNTLDCQGHVVQPIGIVRTLKLFNASGVPKDPQMPADPRKDPQMPRSNP